MAVTMITTENVAAAFDEVAPSYDLMVALNPGYHAHLRAAADALVEWLPRPKPAGSAPLVRLLDLGCGSGASTRAVQLAAQAADVRFAIVGVDASAGMLEQARAKRWPAGVRFEVGQAEEIAWSRDSWGLGGSIQGAFAAYLFRNVADRDAVLAGLFELLADDGVLVVQEYSIAGSRWRAAGLDSGVLAGGHSSWLADISADSALSLPVAQRAVLRLDSDLCRSSVPCGIRRRRGAHRAGLAARDPAHLPGAQAVGSFMIIGRRDARWRTRPGCSRSPSSGGAGCGTA